MTTSLTVTKELLEDHWLITVSVNDGSLLPKDIFVYENTGLPDLGEFYGTCDVDDLVRLKVFSGDAIPVFANRFVRYGQAKIKVDLSANTETVINTLVNSVKDLDTAFAANRLTTRIITVN